MTARRARPCAFLDRDGVINLDVGYAHRPDQLVFAPGAREAVAMLNAAGLHVVVVTNQSGVARGWFTEADVHAFHAALDGRLAAEAGARVDAFYYCPHHPEAVAPRYRALCHRDRKPNPGMILRALAERPIRREGSFLIGDRPSDLAAAAAAGVPGHLYAGGDLRDVVRKALGGAA